MTLPPERTTLGLRCDPKLVNDVLDRADAAPSDPEHTKRVHRRTSCREHECRLAINPPGSPSPVMFAAALRNLSPGGASILVRTFVHLGSDCTILIVDPNRNGIKARGRVVRCRYLEHMLHEVALAFDQPIDPTLVCSNSAPTSILVVDADAASRASLLETLGGSGLEIHCVATNDEALTEISKDFYDCVVLDVAGAGEGNAQCVADLRALFPRTILAALAPDDPGTPAPTPAAAGEDAESDAETPADLRAEVRTAGATEVIDRPYDLERLRTMLEAVRA